MALQKFGKIAVSMKQPDEKLMILQMICSHFFADEIQITKTI